MRGNGNLFYIEEIENGMNNINKSDFMNVKDLADKYGYSGISNILRQFAREAFQEKKIGHDSLKSIEEMSEDLEKVLASYTEYASVIRE